MRPTYEEMRRIALRFQGMETNELVFELFNLELRAHDAERRAEKVAQNAEKMFKKSTQALIQQAEGHTRMCMEAAKKSRQALIQKAKDHTRMRIAATNRQSYLKSCLRNIGLR